MSVVIRLARQGTKKRGLSRRHVADRVFRATAAFIERLAISIRCCEGQ